MDALTFLWRPFQTALPTRSRGMSFKSAPCFRKTWPAVWFGLMPTPSFVMTALVAAGTLNSSAANFRQARKGASSGTVITLNGWLFSDARVILKLTLGFAAAIAQGTLRRQQPL